MSPRRLVTATLGLVFVMAACSSPSPSPGISDPESPAASGSAGELRQVRLLLGFRPDVQFAPFYLAQQAGYFADAGLEVTIEHSDDVLRLVADGQAEFGVADATDLMIARTAGIPARYVYPLYRRFPVALIGQAGTVPTDPAGLAGLRIGTPGRFGSSWHALLALLDAGGLTPDDVTIREYPAFNQVEGLLNGDVDLITGFRVNEPLQLEAQGMEVELVTVDDSAPLPGPGIVVGENLRVDRELIHGFALAVSRAQAAIASDVEAGLAAAIEAVPAIGQNRQTAGAVLEATVDLWLDDDGEIATAVDRELWRTAYRTMEELGFIDGSVPVDEMWDDALVMRL